MRNAKIDRTHLGWNWHREHYDRAAAMAAVNRRRRTRFQRIAISGQHGTKWGYNQGCGCDPCVKANAEWWRAYRGRQRWNGART